MVTSMVTINPTRVTIYPCTLPATRVTISRVSIYPSTIGAGAYLPQRRDADVLCCIADTGTLAINRVRRGI